MQSQEKEMSSGGGSGNQNFLRAALEKGQFLCTAELVLGRDHNVAEAEAFVKEASQQQDGIKVISLTDLPGGNPALPPEGFVSYITEHNLTPVAHLTGKDGNRAFLEGRLHALARMGVENTLALTGDAQKEGFEGKPKPVYDLDSVLILWLLQAMRGGIEYNLGARTAHSTPFDFFAGAAVNPYKVREPDQMMQLYKLQLKIAAGAQFIITQLGFNLRKLYELKQYMTREGLGHVPVLANVYVPTGKIAQMMQSGELAGCVVTGELVRRLETEKKPQRLERAALMVAAVKDLGFAGAHLGGFGLSHRDFMTIVERAAIIGKDWRKRMDELVFTYPNEFYLFPLGEGGLSDDAASYQVRRIKPHASLIQRLSRLVHRYLIAKDSFGARFFASRLKPSNQPPGGNAWRRGLWYKLLELSTLYRKATMGCVSCGDCLQDHLDYAGCSMRWCYKELRNGPCGGSRVDGTCEARAELSCIWNTIYLGTLALGEDPKKFARTLMPPRDWCLDGTNALANRLAGLDNLCKRKEFQAAREDHERGGDTCSS
jgi:methylenetetrahydrofolate reductase (NADPH)